MIHALFQNVIVAPIDAPDLTPEGIVVPDQAKRCTKRARVVSVGAENRSGVEVGDEILYPEMFGQPLEIGGRDMLMLEHDEVLAIVEPGTAIGMGASVFEGAEP